MRKGYWIRPVIISIFILVCVLHITNISNAVSGSSSDGGNTTARTEPKPEEKSIIPNVSNSTLLIISVVIISVTMALGLLVVFWTINKEIRRNTWDATSGPGSATKPGSTPGFDETTLAPKSELDTEPDHYFPYPSDFDRAQEFHPNKHLYPDFYHNEFLDPQLPLDHDFLDQHGSQNLEPELSPPPF